MIPLKLEKLHSYGALKVLPIQLLNRTLYLKYVEELKSIIQEPKPLLYKDFVSVLYSLTGNKLPVSFFILRVNRVGFQTFRTNCKDFDGTDLEL